MKPLGPIPPGFKAIGGELALGGRTASALAEANASRRFLGQSEVEVLDSSSDSLTAGSPNAGGNP